MKRLLIAAALALTSCSPINVGTGHAPAANATAVDEKAVLGVELAYKAALTLAELAVDTGIVRPGTPLAAQVAEADRRAYSAVLAVRAAYRAGNAPTFDATVTEALRAVESLRAAIRS